jgi:hypothetical protein
MFPSLAYHLSKIQQRPGVCSNQVPPAHFIVNEEQSERVGHFLRSHARLRLLLTPLQVFLHENLLRANGASTARRELRLGQRRAYVNVNLILFVS